MFSVTEEHRRNGITILQQTFNVSPVFYDEKQAADYINAEYDKIIVGSDAIWAFENYPLKTPMLPVFPNFYFLNQSIKIPKYSYGCCIGNSSISNLTQEIQLSLSKKLKDFKLISVRDNQTALFVNSLTNYITTRVPDPTFLYEPTLDIIHLKNKLIKLGVNFNKFIILVSDPTPDIINFTKHIDVPNKLVFSMNKTDKLLSIEKLELNPLEWAAVFGLADLSITNRMHPCIMSILHNKPFITFDRRQKVLDLVEYFKIPLVLSQNYQQLLRHWDSYDLPKKRIAYQRIGESFCRRIIVDNKKIFI
jgi:polysaccharide pyruvyl transferase WcaK-like protein